MQMTGSLRIGIDTGGTFTDLVLLESTGRATQLKVPSTPDDPARALIAALRAALPAGAESPPSRTGPPAPPTPSSKNASTTRPRGPRAGSRTGSGSAARTG